MVVQIGAGIAGALMGAVAAPAYVYFVSEILRNNKFRWPAASSTVAILFGTASASAPIGDYVFGSQLWVWFIFGEAAVFLIPFVISQVMLVRFMLYGVRA